MEKIRGKQWNILMQFIQTYNLSSQEYLPDARMKKNGGRNSRLAQVQLAQPNESIKYSILRSLKWWIYGSQLVYQMMSGWTLVRDGWLDIRQETGWKKCNIMVKLLQLYPRLSIVNDSTCKQLSKNPNMSCMIYSMLMKPPYSMHMFSSPLNSNKSLTSFNVARMPPDCGLSNKQQSGVKGSKIWLTYLFMVNVDGSMKLPPLIIGKAQKSHAFQKKSGTQLGFHYQSNAKAWMTASVYQEWLLDWDWKLWDKGRNILLLQDNFSGHVVSDTLTNIQVENFKPNLTMHIQPNDQGLICCFKAYYHVKLISL